MSAITPRRTALVVLATAGLLFLAVMLFGGAHDSAVGPAGAVIMGAFATGCAVNAAWAARSGQRLAWIALATGLGGLGSRVMASGATSLCEAPRRSRLPRQLRLATWCCRYALWAQRFSFPIAMTTGLASVCYSTGFSSPRRCFWRWGAWCGRGGPGEHPAHRLGGHYGYLSRARRHCVNCRADGRTRPAGSRRRCWRRALRPWV